MLPRFYQLATDLDPWLEKVCVGDIVFQEEVLVVYMAFLILKTSIDLARKDQIIFLDLEKAPSIVLTKYSNDADFFSKQSAAVPPKYTNIF